MNGQTDQQLICGYAEKRSEAAFAELVRRHVNLVYSAALRMVRDSHLAQDVTQGVFVALAKQSSDLTDHPVLSGWLYRTTRHLAAKTVRSDVRRRSREHEAAVMNEQLSPGSDASWEQIAPQLDAALSELCESDRDAVLLRYFEHKSAREMAHILGVSDDAAQKRVSRAVDRLRTFFNKREVKIGTSGLVGLISANAVQAAPAGFAATISAATVVGTTVATAAATTATKAIAMTTLQKTIIGTTLAIVAGAGIYEARQASQLGDEVQALKEQQAPLAQQLEQLTSEQEEAARQLTALQQENERLNRNTSELLRLRGEVTQLRNDARRLAGLETENLRLQQEADGSNRTNQLYFTQPFFHREEWLDRGTGKPIDTLLTMFWAMKQGDEHKLTQLVLRTNYTEPIDSFLRMPVRLWDQVTSVQIFKGLEHEVLADITAPQREDSIRVIIQRDFEPPILDGQQVTDLSTRSWNFIRTNGQWLITGSGL